MKFEYRYRPHPCERAGCPNTVQYDDEPFCFTDSPDSGSSVPGYSYAAKHQAEIDEIEALKADALHNIKVQLDAVREAFEARDLQQMRTELVGLQHWADEVHRLAGRL